jgi:hypothetical protein
MSSVIFIDANQYLYFFRANKGKKLLATLNEQKDYIFITEQIVASLTLLASRLGSRQGIFQDISAQNISAQDITSQDTLDHRIQHQYLTPR